MPEPENKTRPMTVAEIVEPPARPKPQVPDHELIRRIGSGAYGEVWLAKNVVGTFRAVKVVYRDSFKDSGPYEREYRGLKKFEPISRSNDGFVDILQIGRNDNEGCFYCVMELADDGGARSNGVMESRSDGKAPSAQYFNPPTLQDSTSYVPKTLRSEIQSRGRLPFGECLQFALSLNLALGHLHRHGLIHRDIKPSNIVFIGGIPKLADIGLVTEVEEARSFVGTEGFIPPEGPNSPQADIYSLGKVIYEMSMGKDRTEFPEPFTALGQATGSQDLEELNTVILKACASNPADRYQSAEDMHVDLALLQSGKSVKSKRMLERRLASARKAGAVVGVVAVLALGGYLYQRHQTREAKRLQHYAEDLVARMQIQNAETLFARGDSSLALAHLAHVLRHHPDNRVAAERIMAALTQRNFPRLMAKPLLHDAKLITAHYSPDGQTIVSAAEDHLVRRWNAQTGEERLPPLRHSNRVNSVEFSPDGRKVLTASSDGTACVLNALTGALMFPPLPHESPVNAATFSPNGEWIATVSADQKVRRFSARTGELLAGPVRHAHQLNAIAFSPDSQWLAMATEGNGIPLVIVGKGELKHRFLNGGEIRLMSFSRDGKRIAGAGRSHSGADVKKDWQVHVWEVESGLLLAGPLVHDHVTSLAFSPDGQHLVTTDIAKVAIVWKVATGEARFQLPHSAAVSSAAFSPDGRQILTASGDRTARLWDASTGVAISEPMFHVGRVDHAEFSPDGGRVLTAGREDKTVKIWSIRPNRSASKSLQHEGWLKSAAFDASGREAITATGATVSFASTGITYRSGGQAVIVWDLGAGVPKIAPTLPPRAEAVAAQFTQAGPKALIAVRQDITEFVRSARIWDLAKGEPVGEEIQHEEAITCADFSADGLKVAVSSEDGIVMIRDTRTGVAVAPPLANNGRLKSVRFSPDSTKLITASDQGTVIIWNVVSGQRLAPPLMHKAGVWFAQFSPRGDRVVTVSLDCFARVWSTNDAMPVELKHSAPVEYAEFSPDGTKVVTASSDRTARIWSASTGRQLTEPLEHMDIVVTARFSPDGLRVITASRDGTAQVWDAETGLKLGDPFRHGDGVVSAKFSNDGRWAITASLDKTAKVWEVPMVTLPISPWLSELAEAVGGQRLNPDRLPEPVSWPDYAALKARLAKEPASDPFIQWAQRFFTDQTTPTTGADAAVQPVKLAE